MQYTLEQQNAIDSGEVQHCPCCSKVQPITLELLDLDADTEASIIVCMVCKNPIDFIQNL